MYDASLNIIGFDGFDLDSWDFIEKMGQGNAGICFDFGPYSLSSYPEKGRKNIGHCLLSV